MTKPISRAEGRFTAKGRAMRDRIIETAGDLIFASGAQLTTLDDVKAAAGASKSQLYHYFSDKDALVRGVIDFQGARVIAAQQPELDDICSIPSLKRWRDKLVQICDAQDPIGGCPIGSLANELACQGHGHALAPHFEQWQALIEQGLTRMQAGGHLRPALNPKTLAVTILAAIQGGLLFAKIQQSSTMLASALDEIIGLIEARQT